MELKPDTFNLNLTQVEMNNLEEELFRLIPSLYKEHSFDWVYFEKQAKEDFPLIYNLFELAKKNR